MKKYLLSTFGVVPGTLKEVEQYFGTNRPATPFVESTVASWRTDVGMLNSVVHLSTLKDQIYSDSDFPNYASKLKAIAPHIVSETHRILAPAPFSPCPSETESKSLCEIRTYRYKRDAIEEVIEKWTLKINNRVALSPLLFCGYTDTKPVSEWVHIWAYRSADERSRIRRLAIDQGLWPPGAFTGLIDQHSILVLSSTEIQTNHNGTVD